MNNSDLSQVYPNSTQNQISQAIELNTRISSLLGSMVTKQLKTAFVHDRIFHLGGAEQLFFDRISQQDVTRGCIFTLFSDRKEIEIDGKTYPVVVALPRWINQVFVRASKKQPPLLRTLFDYRNLIVFYPLLTQLLRRKMRNREPDHVWISSFAAVKNIISPNEKTRYFKITLYLHSPMQYIRTNYKEYLRKLSWRQRIIFIPLSKLLRKRDKKPRLYDVVYANSQYTADCARAYYHLKAKVSYPQLDTVFHDVTPETQPRDYFLYVGRLVKFIREADLVIKLCNKRNLPLLVMGSGPDEHTLKQLAGPQVIFLGQITDPIEKQKIIKQARGLINLTKESCGIATMEALACGVPVFGYDAGATPELVGDKQGLLATSKELASLSQEIDTFIEKEFDREQIKDLFWKHYNALQET